MELLRLAFAAMNQMVDPTGEERRGGAGPYGKYLSFLDSVFGDDGWYIECKDVCDAFKFFLLSITR